MEFLTCGTLFCLVLVYIIKSVHMSLSLTGWESGQEFGITYITTGHYCMISIVLPTLRIFLITVHTFRSLIITLQFVQSLFGKNGQRLVPFCTTLFYTDEVQLPQTRLDILMIGPIHKFKYFVKLKHSVLFFKRLLKLHNFISSIVLLD